MIIVAAGLATATIVVLLVAIASEIVTSFALVYPVAYFVLAVIHTGSRIGRMTYVVDLAEGDQRTSYVAVSNTAMGVLLLVTGAASAALATIGARWALGFLALLGALAVPVGRTLSEVSANPS